MPSSDCLECMGCFEYFCTWCEDPKLCEGCGESFCESCVDDFRECSICKKEYCHRCVEDSFKNCEDEKCNAEDLCTQCLENHIDDEHTELEEEGETECP